jgi:hypothetical protein
VFVKHAVTDEAAEWLRKERVVYESVRGSFMPEYVGAVDDRDTTLVVIEDLSAADWPPPWSRGRIDSALAALAEVQAAQPPAGLDALDAMASTSWAWPGVAGDPEPFLSTGLCSREWLDAALPELLRAGPADRARARARASGERPVAILGGWLSTRCETCSSRRFLQET